MEEQEIKNIENYISEEQKKVKEALDWCINLFVPNSGVHASLLAHRRAIEENIQGIEGIIEEIRTFLRTKYEEIFNDSMSFKIFYSLEKISDLNALSQLLFDYKKLDSGAKRLVVYEINQKYREMLKVDEVHDYSREDRPYIPSHIFQVLGGKDFLSGVSVSPQDVDDFKIIQSLQDQKFFYQGMEYAVTRNFGSIDGKYGTKIVAVVCKDILENTIQLPFQIVRKNFQNSNSTFVSEVEILPEFEVSVNPVVDHDPVISPGERKLELSNAAPTSSSHVRKSIKKFLRSEKKLDLSEAAQPSSSYVDESIKNFFRNIEAMSMNRKLQLKTFSEDLKIILKNILNKSPYLAGFDYNEFIERGGKFLDQLSNLDAFRSRDLKPIKKELLFLMNNLESYMPRNGELEATTSKDMFIVSDLLYSIQSLLHELEWIEKANQFKNTYSNYVLGLHEKKRIGRVSRKKRSSMSSVVDRAYIEEVYFQLLTEEKKMFSEEVSVSSIFQKVFPDCKNPSRIEVKVFALLHYLEGASLKMRGGGEFSILNSFDVKPRSRKNVKIVPSVKLKRILTGKYKLPEEEYIALELLYEEALINSNYMFFNLTSDQELYLSAWKDRNYKRNAESKNNLHRLRTLEAEKQSDEQLRKLKIVLEPFLDKSMGGLVKGYACQISRIYALPKKRGFGIHFVFKGVSVKTIITEGLTHFTLDFEDFLEGVILGRIEVQAVRKKSMDKLFQYYSSYLQEKYSLLSNVEADTKVKSANSSVDFLKPLKSSCPEFTLPKMFEEFFERQQNITNRDLLRSISKLPEKEIADIVLLKARERIEILLKIFQGMNQDKVCRWLDSRLVEVEQTLGQLKLRDLLDFVVQGGSHTDILTMVSKLSNSLTLQSNLLDRFLKKPKVGQKKRDPINFVLCHIGLFFPDIDLLINRIVESRLPPILSVEDEKRECIDLLGRLNLKSSYDQEKKVMIARMLSDFQAKKYSQADLMYQDILPSIFRKFLIDEKLIERLLGEYNFKYSYLDSIQFDSHNIGYRVLVDTIGTLSRVNSSASYNKKKINRINSILVDISEKHLSFQNPEEVIVDRENKKELCFDQGSLALGHEVLLPKLSLSSEMKLSFRRKGDIEKVSYTQEDIDAFEEIKNLAGEEFIVGGEKYTITSEFALVEVEVGISFGVVCLDSSKNEILLTLRDVYQALSRSDI